MCNPTALIKIPLPPFSQNGAYFRNRKYNTKARNYREKFLSFLMLESNQEQIKLITSKFNSKLHGLKVDFLFYQPRNIIFTQKGHLSRRSQDVDNCFKLATDFLFNAKYPEKFDITNFNIDDQFIIELSGAHKISLDDEFLITVAVSLLPLSDL